MVVYLSHRWTVWRGRPTHCSLHLVVWTPRLSSGALKIRWSIWFWRKLIRRRRSPRLHGLMIRQLSRRVKIVTLNFGTFNSKLASLLDNLLFLFAQDYKRITWLLFSIQNHNSNDSKEQMQGRLFLRKTLSQTEYNWAQFMDRIFSIRLMLFFRFAINPMTWYEWHLGEFCLDQNSTTEWEPAIQAEDLNRLCR